MQRLVQLAGQLKHPPLGLKQSEKMCMSNFDLQEPEMQETSFI